MRNRGRKPDYASPTSNKAAVVSVLQRGGRVQSTHVEKVTAENLREMVNTMVDEDAHVMTDSSTVLKKAFLGKRTHSQVNHTEKEYVRYEDGLCITTNAIEGYFCHFETRHQWRVSPRWTAASTPLLE